MSPVAALLRTIESRGDRSPRRGVSESLERDSSMQRITAQNSSRRVLARTTRETDLQPSKCLIINKNEPRDIS